MKMLRLAQRDTPHPGLSPKGRGDFRLAAGNDFLSPPRERIEVRGIALAVTVVVAALGLALGCSTHNGAYVPATAPGSAAENMNTVVLLSEKLYNNVAVEGQQAKYSDDGRLQVYANLRNRTDKRIKVQVQTVFKDENGFSTGDETAWETIFLPPLSQHAYQSIAQNSKARKYTIRVRKLQ
jgi:uncharacterized protein YcfL